MQLSNLALSHLPSCICELKWITLAPIWIVVSQTIKSINGTMTILHNVLLNVAEATVQHLILILWVRRE